MDMKEDKIYQLWDAQMDMLKGLNVLTDKQCPSAECVKAMGILSRAIKDLQETICMVHDKEYEHDHEAAEMKK